MNATTKSKDAAPAHPWGNRKVESKPLASLKPYDRNARTHSPEQVEQIIASIKQWGWTSPVLIDEAGLILAGHGRVTAAAKMGLAEVPCIVLDGLSDVQKRAYVLADNKLALNAGWDEEILKSELDALADLEFDLDLTGFGEADLDALEPVAEPEPDALSANYSRKIEAPIYRIKGEKPSEAQLYDETRTEKLLAEIHAAKMPPEVEAFLIAAARRHTVFHFRNIAEYYAHAPAEVQDLMEKSALVVIDFDKAIEQGFVDLTAAMMGKAEESKGRNNAE